MIKNKANGMMYIGQTYDYEERWRTHQASRSNCRYLKSAFNKYGIDNFEFKVILICFDEDMNAYEIDYMHKYNTLVPNGYNLREGGNSGKHHEETKKKIADSLRGKPSPLKGKQGIPHTKESKEKIKQALTGKTPANLGALIERAKRLAKPIIQLTDDGKFVKRYDSSVPAGAAMNVSKRAIHNACQKNNKPYWGFKWMYEKDYLGL